MNWPRVMRRGGFFFLIAMALAGCQSRSLDPALPLSVRTTGLTLTIPAGVQRIAVFYPSSSNPDFLGAYQRLEGAAFQLESRRPTLTVVDCFHLVTSITEQQPQVTGVVTGHNALRIGHLLGVDSVLL